jgi:lipid A 3-O-deacylase
MKGYRFYLFTFLYALSTACLSDPHYGAQVSIPIISKEPSPMSGYQFMFNYDPDRFKWRQFNVYVDGGFSRFYQNNVPYYSGINIYSVAPVVRYTFKRHGPFRPYIELGVGFAYLNHTHLENRNLGIHFSFQDRIGVGTLLGASEKMTLGIHVLHYSNARLSSHNSGISVPLVLDVGYRFN